MSIVKFEFSYNTTTGEFSVVNVETGEVKSTKPSVSGKPKVEGGNTPTLVLEDNKYCLNQAAVDLMEVVPGDKLDIKYKKIDGRIQPVIGKDEDFGTKGGCKLTKSFTVSCRGSKNTELSKYGTEFKVVAFEEQEGIFILSNGDAVETPSATEELLDLDLQSIIDDPDVTEIDSSIFQL